MHDTEPCDMVVCVQTAVSPACGPDVCGAVGPQNNWSLQSRQWQVGEGQGRGAICILRVFVRLSLPAVSWPLADERHWRPARAGCFPCGGRPGIHNP